MLFKVFTALLKRKLASNLPTPVVSSGKQNQQVVSLPHNDLNRKILARSRKNQRVTESYIKVAAEEESL